MVDLLFDGDIRLIRPDRSHADEAMAMAREFSGRGEIMYGGSRLDRSESYAGWLERVERNADAATVERGRVPSEQFFIARASDGALVGAIVIRRELSEAMRRFAGHIGYSVRHSERRKGYASRALGLAVQYLNAYGVGEVLVTCNKENLASRRTIERCGGHLLIESVEEDGAVVLCYAINGMIGGASAKESGIRTAR